MDFKIQIAFLSIFLLLPVSLMSSPRTDLIKAIESSNLDAVKTLLDLNVDIKQRLGTSENTNYTGSTFLHIVARNGNPMISELLLSRGGNPNEKDINGSTAPYAAIQSGQCDILFTLLKSKNFDPKITDQNGDNLISKAIEMNSLQCIGAILESGKFNINAKDKDGYTPEVKASLRGNQLIIKLLKIASGKDSPDSKVKYDNAEKKILDFKDYVGDYAAVFLLKKGATLPDEKGSLEYFKTVIIMEKESRMTYLYGRKYFEDYAKSVDLLSKIEQKYSDVSVGAKESDKVSEQPEYQKNLGKIWDRNEFHSAYTDQSRAEIKNSLGTPLKIYGSGRFWDYSIRIKDPESGKVFKSVSIEFSAETGGKVVEIQYLN